MSNGGLTQEEVDRIMQESFGDANADSNGQLQSDSMEIEFTPEAQDFIGEIGNISMGAAATALYSILGRKVVITTPKVTVTSYDKLTENRRVPYFVVGVDYTGGFSGSNLFVLQLHDCKVITDIMMGGDGTNTDQEMDELHISAISEAMNQMMGAMSTSMATLFNRLVNITPPVSKIVTFSDQYIIDIINKNSTPIVKVEFALEIEGILESNITQLLPYEFAMELLEGIMGKSAVVNAPEQKTSSRHIKNTEEFPVSKSETSHSSVMPHGSDIVVNIAPNPPKPQQARPEVPKTPPTVDARPVRLASFDQPLAGESGYNSNEIGLDLLLDVPMQVRVELGKCKKSIKEILDMSLGTIITLDRLAGESVDVIVNGKPIAKGEVVVVDDNYGIRITEISAPAYRIGRG